MPEDTFLDAAPDDIARRIQQAAAGVVGAPVDVRVGAEGFGYRNVGLRIPRARRSRLEAANLRVHVSRALEAVGVSMWPAAIAPRVWGDIEGSVRVRTIAPRGPQDASSFATPPPERGVVVGR